MLLLRMKLSRTLKSALFGFMITGGIVACGDDAPDEVSPDHPTLQREGCRAPSTSHGPNIIADATWQELTNNGLAWVLIVLREPPRLADGKKDLRAIGDIVQIALADMDVGPSEKVFASETVPIISMQLNTARAHKMAGLDYVCVITDDRAQWPLD